MADPTDGASPVERLASHLAAVRFADLPPLAGEHAKVAISSTIASAAAGAALGSTRIVRELALERGGRPEATIWFGAGEHCPVTEAARVNAMLSDAAACDDSDFRTIAHTGTTVCAVALALAERVGAGGRDALTAIVAGYEASGRFGEATTPWLGRNGFHPVALNGIGAAVAAAKLLGAGERQMLHAIVLACTAASGLLVGTNGWAREYQAGTAVASGVEAALAATRGFAVDAFIADGPRGLIATMAGPGDAEALSRDLGVEWDIVTDLGIKLRPGGYPFASAVEAAIEASAAVGGSPDDFTRIVVSGPHLRELVGPRHPTDFVEAIHSLAYYLAAGAHDREFGWDHIEPAKFEDPGIRRLLDLVEVDPDPAGGVGHHEFGWGATVTITTASGAEATRLVDAPIGSARRGIEWSDVDDKLRALMSRAGHPESAVAAVAATIGGLDSADGIGGLTGLLRAP